MSTVSSAPTDFLKSIVGKPVIVKLSWGIEYRGVMACLDGYMNVCLEQTEEYQLGSKTSYLGDVFLRGSNVLFISQQ
jgi:small nuclear ribonucleoprotein (snRNP)-like protein